MCYTVLYCNKSHHKALSRGLPWLAPGLALNINSILCSGPHYQKLPRSQWISLLLVSCIDIVVRVFVVTGKIWSLQPRFGLKLGYFSLASSSIAQPRRAMMTLSQILKAIFRSEIPSNSRISSNHLFVNRDNDGRLPLWWNRLLIPDDIH